MKPSPAVTDLLIHFRGHPAFQELLKSVERPKVSPFRLSEAEQSEKARAKWIYESGKLAGHNAWLGILTGQPSEQEN
jgi:hypothetical protein